MSTFGELCPLFNTGVYNELYLGMITGTLYTSVTMNFIGGPYANSASPTSFRFGRTVVVTGAWAKRKTTAPTTTANIYVGRRLLTATAAQTLFATLTFTTDVTTFPQITNYWQDLNFSTSMTLNTADVLDICQQNAAVDEGSVNALIIVQYREK